MSIFDPFISFLSLLFSRTRVRESAVAHLVSILREKLKEKNFPYSDKITDAAGNSLVQVALQRAAEQERDGCPRSGPTLLATERLADEIIEVYHSYPDTNPRIKNILHFHKVL